MSQTMTAVYDGEVFRPEESVDLEPNTRCVITVVTPSRSAAPGDAWKVLEELTGSVVAPADWASEHDHYLYGTPKPLSGQ